MELQATIADSLTKFCHHKPQIYGTLQCLLAEGFESGQNGRSSGLNGKSPGRTAEHVFQHF